MNDQKPQPPQTREEWQQLDSLLPSPPSSNASDGESASGWTDELLARAKLANIRRHIRAGWKFVDGLLKRGAVTKLPTAATPLPEPWEKGYNPVVHSVAARMGGIYVAPGVFRLKHNGLLVDGNGALLDQDACTGCGTTRGADGRVVGPDSRWTVRTQSQNPFSPPWVQAWTYCRTCVTPAELQSHRRWQDEQRMKAEDEARRQENRGRR